MFVKMRSVLNAVIFLFVFFICGCKTRSLDYVETIQIIEGISGAQALDAVALAAEPPADKAKTRGPIKSYEDGAWTVQDRNTNSIVSAYSIDRRSVTVRYTVEGRVLVPRVESGLNVRLSETRVHGNTLVWINRHAADIKAAMWKIKSEAKN
jgi:hypothetical protein